MRIVLVSSLTAALVCATTAHAGQPTTGPTPVAAAATVPPFFRQSAQTGEPKARRPVPPPQPRRRLTETQRANLESAARIRRQQRDR